MGSKERIQRIRDLNHKNILDAALQIGNKGGWGALSMRKIAEAIEYTPPMIYEYFDSKELILSELTRKGFSLLGEHVIEAKRQRRSFKGKMEAMWLAYWRFAIDEPQLYRLMFGVGAHCCPTYSMQEFNDMTNIFRKTIASVIPSGPTAESEVDLLYYTLWSLAHGLVSIKMLRCRNQDDIGPDILIRAVTNVLRSIP